MSKNKHQSDIKDSYKKIIKEADELIATIQFGKECLIESFENGNKTWHLHAIGLMSITKSANLAIDMGTGYLSIVKDLDNKIKELMSKN